jgi:tRNA modification GTPase
MFSTADTIVAIATPPGRGGLGVVRLSGPDALRIARELVGRASPFQPRHATFAHLAADLHTGVGDQVVVTTFPAPRSYTGQDVAEVSAHGSPVVLDGILKASLHRGARLAQPGEFTLRGFLHGKRDLVQAEAVADLVDAVTPLQARAAFDQLEGTLTQAIEAIETQLFDLVARLEASLDFPDEGYHFIEPGELLAALQAVLARLDDLLAGAARGRLVREGAAVTLVGAPNVGKSSLFNLLLNTNRAIVTATPGTTRDLLTERVEMAGLSLALIDTAGLRETDDEVEREGVARTKGSLRVADLAVVVLDRSRPLTEDDHRALAAAAGQRRVVVANKADLPPAWSDATPEFAASNVVAISARTGIGVSLLIERIATMLLDAPAGRDTPRVTNIRHVQLLQQARVAIARGALAVEESGGALPEEFLLADLQDALELLQEVTGRRTSEDLLRHIFQRFCIGK